MNARALELRDAREYAGHEPAGVLVSMLSPSVTNAMPRALVQQKHEMAHVAPEPCTGRE